MFLGSRRSNPLCYYSTQAEVESTYVEKDQSYCWEIRDEYLRHFINSEFVVGK